MLHALTASSRVLPHQTQALVTKDRWKPSLLLLLRHAWWQGFTCITSATAATLAHNHERQSCDAADKFPQLRDQAVYLLHARGKLLGCTCGHRSWGRGKRNVVSGLSLGFCKLLLIQGKMNTAALAVLDGCAHSLDVATGLCCAALCPTEAPSWTIRDSHICGKMTS